jgi:serine/threonine protein phosphatase PrpC
MTHHITATDTREGTGGPNADATAVYTAADGSTCAAIVDGIGHDPDTAALAPILATVAARIGAQRGALAGLLTAALMVADEGLDGDEPDAAAAVALARPGRDTVVAWVGDCRGYGWNGRRLRLYTNDHTVGRQLRESGGIPLDVAASHDHWLRVSLSRATPATAWEVVIPAGELVILTTDGVHDQVDPDELARWIRDFADEIPQAIATGLVAAARDADGTRDDATAIVITTLTGDPEDDPGDDA